MSITIKDVEHVATLARLEFTEKEKEKFTTQLNQIVGYIEKLSQIDTSNVPPFSHVLDLNNVMREDVARPSFPQEEMMKNAPERTEKFFKVPKVIGDR